MRCGVGLRLIAVDARTGRVQWTVNMGNGGFTNVFPVATNARFVFATNVTHIFSFYRDTGVIDFSMDLGTTAVAGLAADSGGVYVVLATQPGAAGAHRVMALNLPNPISFPEAENAKGAVIGTVSVVRADAGAFVLKHRWHVE